MRRVIISFTLTMLFNAASVQGGVITVKQFLTECANDREPCMAFVMGVVEGARHQTREQLQSQPYAFLMHGKPVCLPTSWGSETLTNVVLDILQNQRQTHQYSAVSGVLYALAGESNCYTT